MCTSADIYLVAKAIKHHSRLTNSSQVQGPTFKTVSTCVTCNVSERGPLFAQLSIKRRENFKISSRSQHTHSSFTQPASHSTRPARQHPAPVCAFFPPIDIQPFALDGASRATTIAEEEVILCASPDCKPLLAVVTTPSCVIEGSGRSHVPYVQHALSGSGGTAALFS